MFTKLASFAAAALVIASIAPPAHAGPGWFNGISIQGTGWNGFSLNGNAVATTGFAIDRIELPVALR